MVMLAELHVKHTPQLVGKCLDVSDWDWALSKAEVFTPGRVSSALNDQQIKRSHYCH